MPKLKTKSGAKKRFSLTASGKVKGSPAFLSHNLRKRSQKMKRQARGTMILNDSGNLIMPCKADGRLASFLLELLGSQNIHCRQVSSRVIKEWCSP